MRGLSAVRSLLPNRVGRCTLRFQVKMLVTPLISGHGGGGVGTMPMRGYSEPFKADVRRRMSPPQQNGRAQDFRRAWAFT